jgi:hypothetical protein
MNIFYVYIYYHPVTNIPFYVGKGSKKRAWIHLTSKAHNHFIHTIEKIRKEGNEPLVKIYKNNLCEKEAYELEMLLIKKYGKKVDGTGCLCNKTNGGEGGGVIGRVVSEETRKKMSESQKGKKLSEEQIEHLRELGRNVSEEIKKRISITNTGRKLSEETRKKMSDSRRGRVVSEETRKKLSESLKGRVVSKETKEKLRIANIGKKHSEETKNKLREAYKNMSQEKKDKICTWQKNFKKGNNI